MKKTLFTTYEDFIMDNFEDWHSRKYSDERRFGNKILFL